MGYYSSAFVFFGVEIEKPSNDKMDKFYGLNNGVTGIRTGCMATGVHERWWLMANDSYAEVLEDRTDIGDAIRITAARQGYDWYFKLRTELKNYLPVSSEPTWVVASSGG